MTKQFYHGQGYKLMTDLLPCPFCGGAPEFWDGLGTQAYLTCGCAIASVNMQVSDCLTEEERFGNNGKAQKGFAWLDAPHYRYEEKAIQRVNEEMIAVWNTRTPPADDGWQPIESAPRDGTVILACYQPKNLQKTTFFVKLKNEHRWENWKGAQPTHWRPLPAPPKTGEE